MITLPEMTVVGTLVADPELRFTPNGVAVANFRVACNDRRLNKDTGKWEDGEATFLRCSVWREYAEHVGESLSRGDRVVVIGRLRERSYEKDGEKRTAYELDAEEVTPSLRFATAKVNRVERNGGSSSSSKSPAKGSGWRASGGAADDPWGGAPSAPSDPEPPF
jgi:single-strand DNA-binding protein